MKNNYFEMRDMENLTKIREMAFVLPDFCFEFFRGIEQTTTPLTRLGYARDIKIFLEFLSTNIPVFKNKEIINFTYADLAKVTSTHIEIYLSYLTMYKNNGKIFKNKDYSRSRKLSSVRSMFKYFFKKGKLESNVTEKIDTPKINEKPIVKLEVDEVVRMLNTVESGNNLSKMQKEFHKHTKKRDFAMLSLFLGTGIRISECVGLNVEDIDFPQNAFQITRKGGNRVILYFGDEVANALKEYVEERNQNKKVEKGERALFLSMQNKRIGVRAVENIVKKYSQIVTPLKHITPHKLRSTFGTNLYRETNDIYVVADVLGHRDVNTTRKHYAAISDDIKRRAADKVKLR